MKWLSLIGLAGAIVCLSADPAPAQSRHSYRGYIEYHGYHEYGGDVGCWSPPAYRYAPRYRYPGYGYRGGYGLRFYRGETHDEAVRRIMATHSRDRYYTHPRSLYNQPSPYSWYRW